MDAFRKEIIELIDVCRSDRHFLLLSNSLRPWREYVIDFGVGEAPLQLMDILFKHYAEYFHKQWGSVRINTQVTPLELAQWLCVKASSVGAEKSFGFFESLIENPQVPLYVVSLVDRIEVKETLHFDDKTYLCNFLGLPPSIQFQANRMWDQDRRACSAEQPVFIVTELTDTILGDNDLNMSSGSVAPYSLETLRHIELNCFLSLFSNRTGSRVHRQCYVYGDDVPCSGVMNLFHGAYSFVNLSNWCGELSVDSADQIRQLYKKFMSLSKSVQNSLKVSLHRKSKALSSYVSVDAAIDLGICAESVLTPKDSSEQLALQVRVLGSKLATDDPVLRAEYYHYLKAFYGIRSSAVHNGEVKNTYTVKYLGKEETHKIIMKTSEILSACLIKVIEQGGLDDEQKEKLLYS